MPRYTLTDDDLPARHGHPAGTTATLDVLYDEARLLDAIHDIQRGRADDAADRARDLQREDC